MNRCGSLKIDDLVPFFKGLKEQYGEPVALVHDMGKGIINAVEEVFPDTPDFICHFHFLRDIGKDLPNDEYCSFIKRLRRLKIRPTLRRKAKYLEQKIAPVSHDIAEIAESLQKGNWQATDLEHAPMVMAYALIHWIFDYPSQSNGYDFPFDRAHLDFYRRIQEVHQLLEQINKYWKKLFADPITAIIPDGIRTVQPQRTNNILERFFRDEKRRNRKRTGMTSLNKVLKSILANSPLVQNLRNAEYIRIILNGCPNLAGRFSQIDAPLVLKEMDNIEESNGKILTSIKKLVKDDDVTIKISALVHSATAN